MNAKIKEKFSRIVTSLNEEEKKIEDKASAYKENSNLEFRVFRSLKEIARRKANRPSLCLQDEGVLPYSLLYYKTPVKKEVMNDEKFYN